MQPRTGTHLLNPIDPDTDPWEHELTRALAAQPCGEDPAWYAQPALARINATSPDLRHAFAKLSAGVAYAAQVKPVNFLAGGITALPLCRFAQRG